MLALKYFLIVIGALLLAVACALPLNALWIELLHRRRLAHGETES